MRTDTLFFTIFKKFPFLFFELIGRSAEDAQRYQFYSLELKQAAFRLDGLFLPQEDIDENPIYFVEVQFQKDAWFYARLFAEIFAFLYQEKVLTDWYAVAIYPSRKKEADITKPYHRLLDKGQVIRIYLDDIEYQAERFWGLNIFRLIDVPTEEAKQLTKRLIKEGEEKLSDALLRRELFEMVETILIYKFPQLTRKEVETMFDLIDIKETKIYQEAFEEGKLEGKLEGIQEGMLEGKLEVIEMVLDSKFGIEGLRLLPEIRKVKDMDILETIRVALRSAKTVEELRSIYQP